MSHFFQLETDETILLDKARHALLKYGHHLVIANQLHSRKREVLLVSESSSDKIVIPNEETEIEVGIVSEVINRHQNFINGGGDSASK